MTLKNLFRNKYLFPLLFLVYGVVYILIGEKLPANEGLGWDGLRYGDVVKNLLYSSAIDSYYVARIFPSIIIRIFLELLNIPLENNNIVYAFEIFNLICITIAFYFLQEIFTIVSVSDKNKIIGNILFLFSFCISKFLFFYPVLTDSFALLSSTILLYAYLKNYSSLLLSILIISAFSFPIIFYGGIFMFIFPFQKKEEPIILEKNKLQLLSILSLGYIAIQLIIILWSKKFEYMAFNLTINYTLLPITIIGLGLYYFFIIKLISFNNFFSLKIEKNFLIRCSIIIIVFVAYSCARYLMNKNNTESIYSPAHFNNTVLTLSLIRPFITFTSHFAYYGLVLIILFLNWNSFCESLSKFGKGLTLAVFVNLFFFGIATESRFLINLFPIIIVFLSLSLDKFEINPFKLALLILVAIIASKIWLPINYDLTVGVDEFGTIAFPNQKLFMNMGPWMSEKMWLLQTIVMFVLLGFFYFLFRKKTPVI